MTNLTVDELKTLIKLFEQSSVIIGINANGAREATRLYDKLKMLKEKQCPQQQKK